MDWFRDHSPPRRFAIYPPGILALIPYLNGGMGVAHRKINQNPLTFLRALLAVIFNIPFDKGMNACFGKTWYQIKDRLAIKRIHKAIRRHKS